MSLLITDREIDAVDRAVGAGGRASEFFAALANRALDACGQSGIVQTHDTMEWRHIVWERFADAAFTIRFADRARKLTDGGRVDALASWLHDTTLEVVRYDRDEWIGPWFRVRKDPPEGHLETAHIAMGVATTLDHCPDLFDTAETEEIRVVLRDRGQDLTRNSLESRLKAHTHINNWFMVLLSGYVTASALLGDVDAVRWSAEQATVAASLYNGDSYGESVQYWNYATIHLANIVDVLRRFIATSGETIDLDPGIEASYAACLGWINTSILGVHDLPGWGTGYPNCVNFGDSSHMFRPSGDVLLSIASHEDKGEQEAIARGLFELLYADPTLEPVDRQAFGFFNTFAYRTVIYLALDESARANGTSAVLAEPSATRPAKHRIFSNGDAVLRPSSEHPDSLLAFRGEYGALNVSAHKHEDLLSFQYFFRGERIFTDPGHCCYRLATQRFSKSTAAHSTISLQTVNGVAVTQNTVSGNIWVPGPILARTTRRVDLPGGGIVIGCDAASAYGSPMTRVERVFVLPDEHSLFVLDIIEANEPLTAMARFVVNNRDNAMTFNHPAWDRTVIRRGDAGAKLFHLAAQSRSGAEYRDHDARFDLSWGYQHDVYHPQPNQKGQGKEGSTVAMGYATVGPATSLRLLHGVAADEERKIRKWHFRTRDDGTVHIEPPSRQRGWALGLDATGFRLINVATGETHIEVL